MFQGRPLYIANLAIERHASKIYTRAMFENFGEVLYEAGQYKIEEISKGKTYFVRRYHPEKHDKWCRVVYAVGVGDNGKEIMCYWQF